MIDVENSLDQLIGSRMEHARIHRGRQKKECAEVMGISTAKYSSYTSGKSMPSLPELELLAFFLNLPIDFFINGGNLELEAPSTSHVESKRLISLRQKIIGVMIRKARREKGYSSKTLAKKVGISPNKLKSYEMGEQTIPLSDLNNIVISLDQRLIDYFDTRGMIGKQQAAQIGYTSFSTIPAEIQEFACKPINIPYLRLAKKLSEVSAERLRSIAENILEITF